MIAFFFKPDDKVIDHVEDEGISDDEVFVVDASEDEHVPGVDKTGGMTPSTEDLRVFLDVQTSPHVFKCGFFWGFDVAEDFVEVEAPHVASGFAGVESTA